MASSNYEGEIKQSMAEKPKSKSSKRPPSGKPPSGGDVANRPPSSASGPPPSQPSAAVAQTDPMQEAAQQGMAKQSFGASGGGSDSPAHAAMAASIAHAILQKGG